MRAAEFDTELVHRSWTAAMRSGDFERAWRATDEIEGRRRARGWRDSSQGDLLWDGSKFDGERVLVRCLHGLGDTLQFMRFIPHLQRTARDVMFAAQPALLPLISSDGRFGRVINGWADQWPDHDVEIEVMELAYALRITCADLPGEIPYLNPTAIARKAAWRPPDDRQGKKIGVIWKASQWDQTRSLPSEVLSTLKFPGLEFYSLQQDLSASEFHAIPLQLTSVAQDTRDPLDAAAAMLWMDLIITVDAMPAHLAGALGRPALVILKKDPDWRWMDAGETSPWYPTLRLCRYESDWSRTMELVRASLLSWYLSNA
jgi:hypothetical protein